MVVVSHQHRFIFLKTRKTAGTSIEMLLEKKIAPSGHQVVEGTPTISWRGGIIGARLQVKTEADSAKRRWREHMPARYIKDKLGESIWEDYFRFTAVRNPFEHAVSSFFWNRHHNSLPPLSDFDEARALFDEFLLSPSYKSDRSVVHVKNEFIAQEAIRFEHIADDLLCVGQKVGLELRIEDLPYTKSETGKFPNRHVGDYFDEARRALVLERMAWVFDHFDYSTRPDDTLGRRYSVPPDNSSI